VDSELFLSGFEPKPDKDLSPIKQEAPADSGLSHVKPPAGSPVKPPGDSPIKSPSKTEDKEQPTVSSKEVVMVTSDNEVTPALPDSNSDLVRSQGEGEPAVTEAPVQSTDSEDNGTGNTGKQLL